MYNKNQNDSIFQAHIIAEFKKIIEYITSIPGGFKEHFVKYDDNSQDSTVIVFNPEYLKGIRNTIDMSNEFINSYYYEGDKARYLETGLLERLIEKSKTEDEKQRIINMYGYMISKNKKDS